jgi:transposase-like protein
MTTGTRRKYTEDFKREAVALVTEQGYSIAEAARSLDIGANMLGPWKREFEAQASDGTLSQDEREEGFDVGRYRVRRLMKAPDLVVKPKRKFKVTTDSNHRLPMAENVLDPTFSPPHPTERGPAISRIFGPRSALLNIYPEAEAPTPREPAPQNLPCS